MRKDVAHARELARAHTAAAVDTLVGLLRARSEAVRVAAAEALLNRGWGRPTVMVSEPIEDAGSSLYSYLSREQAEQLRALDAAVDRGEIDLLELYDRAAPLFKAEQRAWAEIRASR